MLNQKLRSIFAGENDLGNKLHNYYIYHLIKSNQIIAKNKFLDLLNNYSDEKFVDIGHDDNSKTVIKKYIYCKNEPN